MSEVKREIAYAVWRKHSYASPEKVSSLPVDDFLAKIGDSRSDQMSPDTSTWVKPAWAPAVYTRQQLEKLQERECYPEQLSPGYSCLVLDFDGGKAPFGLSPTEEMPYFTKDEEEDPDFPEVDREETRAPVKFKPVMANVPGPDLCDLEDVWAGYAFAAHQTWSYEPEFPRSRIILPLSRDASPAEYSDLHKWAELRMGDAGHKTDVTGRHTSHRWTLPRVVKTGRRARVVVAYESEGNVLLDVDSILAAFRASSTAPYLSGSPTTAEWLDVSLPVETLEDKNGIEIKVWIDTSKPGDKLKCSCPHSPGSSVGSAFLKRFQSGVLLTCTADTHGHHSPLRLWWGDPKAGSWARRPAPAVLDRLQWAHNKNGDRIWPPKPTILNFYTSLQHDHETSGRIWWDTLQGRVMWGDKEMDSEQDARIAMHQELHYGMTGNVEGLRAAYYKHAHDLKRNPLMEWLSECRTEGTTESILEEWAVRMGGPDNRITRLFSRNWLLQAATRALDPGCKADNVICFTGRQGTGKTEGLNLLVGGSLRKQAPWFSNERIDNPGSKDAGYKIAGKWIWEIGELEGMDSSDIARWKAFITRKEERYRRVWERTASDVPRLTVFAATTNNPDFLRDDENRRFWPVPCERPADWEWIQKNHRAIWAWALKLAMKGVKFHIQSSDLEEVAEHTQQYSRDTPWEYEISQWVSTNPPEVFTIQYIATNVLDIPKSRHNSGIYGLIGRTLAKCPTHKKVRVSVDGMQVTVYALNHMTKAEIVAWIIDRRTTRRSVFTMDTLAEA
jgi:hypothetical protein